MPRISVVMPVYNCRQYIEESVNSIITQTYSDFEFIIIDDCSADGTYEYLKSLIDPRIKLVRKPQNSGIIVSLNLGLQMANGEYIARMDSDDISLPERFKKQVMFLDQNPDIGVCGTWVRIFGWRNYVKKYPQTPEEIVSRLLFECPLAHPSVMVRKDILVKHNLCYDINYKHIEDYELWTRVSKISKLSNIQEVLLKYRLHVEQISSTNAAAQGMAKLEISIKYLSKLYKISDDNEAAAHRLFFPGRDSVSIDMLKEGHAWLIKLIDENTNRHIFPEPGFRRLLAERWLLLCIKARHNGFRVLTLYWNSTLRSPLFQSLAEIMKLLINRPYKQNRKQKH